MKYITFRLLGFAVLLFLAAISFKGCLSGHKENIILQDRIVQREDSLQYYRDAAGREHATRLQLQADEQTLKAIYATRIDSLTRILGIKEKQLQTFLVIGTEATGAVTAPLTPSQSRPEEWDFSFSDGYLSASGTVSDSLRLSYRYRDSLFYSTYWKRSWLLGPKRYYQDAFSLNKNSHITGLEGIRLPIKEPGRFSLGPQVTYGWNGSSWTWTIGVGLQYSIFRF